MDAYIHQSIAQNIEPLRKISQDLMSAIVALRYLSCSMNEPLKSQIEQLILSLHSAEMATDALIHLGQEPPMRSRRLYVIPGGKTHSEDVPF